MFWNCIFVGCGGFLGSILRYLCSSIKVPIYGFPLITLGINAIGSFAIMFFTGVVADRFAIDSHLLLFLRVGLCGGFTTFSTFSAEVLGLFENGNITLAVLYALASCVICVVFAFLGQAAATAVSA